MIKKKNNNAREKECVNKTFSSTIFINQASRGGKKAE